MRDIIYRGKDKHKKWQYGFYLKEKTIDGNVLSYIDRSDMLYNIDKVEVDPNTIQEYSGFTDKNKTRVFEGDILYKQGYWKYYVEFEDGAFRAIPLNLIQKYSWVHYNLKHYVGNDILDEDKFEIIGNIYDKEDEQMELNTQLAQLLEDNEKNTKYISILQTDLEKMKNQRDRAIEKLMNNMSLSPDGLYEIIRR